MSDITLPKIVLDPRNEQELLALAYQRTLEASGGTLTDFRPGSPLAALLEGQVFSIAELFYYMNLLPEALAVETFRLLGITRSGGTKATGTLRFLLQTSLGTDFIINPGFSVPYKDGYFVLKEQLVIPRGALESDVLVEASIAGASMNAPEFDVFITSTGVNFLQTIWNNQAITGGSDLEDLTDTISRAQQSLRSRDVLVSVTDYELAAQALLGAGSRALCIPFLSSDKTLEAPGQVHLFLCDADGQPVSSGTAQSIQAELQRKVFAASQVWISPMELENLTIEVTCGVNLVSESLADEIALAVYGYLSPLAYPWGAKVRPNEIGFSIRQIPDVTEVDSVIINQEPLPYLLPHRWSCPFADSVIIQLVQPDGLRAIYYQGLGGDPE
jgi:hypothetical protein